MGPTFRSGTTSMPHQCPISLLMSQTRNRICLASFLSLTTFGGAMLLKVCV
ncbi:hypothetical protein BO83DRAFT_380841, partial [Aspergillus eucalypticola CBS 122712]